MESSDFTLMLLLGLLPSLSTIRLIAKTQARPSFLFGGALLSIVLLMTYLSYRAFSLPEAFHGKEDFLPGFIATAGIPVYLTDVCRYGLKGRIMISPKTGVVSCCMG